MHMCDIYSKISAREGRVDVFIFTRSSSGIDKPVLMLTVRHDQLFQIDDFKYCVQRPPHQLTHVT